MKNLMVTQSLLRDFERLVFKIIGTAVTVKTFGFCRTKPEFSLIFLILNMII